MRSKILYGGAAVVATAAVLATHAPLYVYAKAKNDWTLDEAQGAKRAAAARELYVTKRAEGALDAGQKSLLRTSCAQSTAMTLEWLGAAARGGTPKKNPVKGTGAADLATALAETMAAGGVAKLCTDFDKLTKGLASLPAAGAGAQVAGLERAVKDAEEGMYLLWLQARDDETHFWLPLGLVRSSGKKTLFNPYSGQIHTATTGDLPQLVIDAWGDVAGGAEFTYRLLPVDVDLSLEEARTVIKEVADEVYKSNTTQELGTTGSARSLKDMTIGADVIRLRDGFRITKNGAVLLERDPNTTAKAILAALKAAFDAEVADPKDSAFRDQDTLQKELQKNWDGLGDLTKTMRLGAQTIITTGNKLYTNAMRERGVDLWVMARTDEDYAAGDNWLVDIDVTAKGVSVRHTLTLHEFERWQGETKVYRRDYKLRFVHEFTLMRDTGKVVASPLKWEVVK